MVTATRQHLLPAWAALRKLIAVKGLDSVPFGKAGLPTRANWVFDKLRVDTMGALVAYDLEDLLHVSNVGLTTAAAIVQKAAFLAGLTAAELGPDTADHVAEPEAAQGLTARDGQLGAAPASFVHIVDHLFGAMKGTASEIVQLRFLEHLTLQECGDRLNLSRERIRQVENQVLARLADRCSDAGWKGASILDDGFIEFAELQGDATSHSLAPGLYVTLARATLLKAQTFRQLEAFYGRELHVLIDDLGDSPSALAGILTDREIHQRATELTPALLEWPRERLVGRARKELGVAGKGGRARILPLLRVLVRRAGGEMSVMALRQKLAALLAAGGSTKVVGDSTIRALVLRSREFYIRDRFTVARLEPESETRRAWVERAVAFILRNDRPTSLLRFLEENRNCDVDEFALASVLNLDLRVERVGRRLYCPVNGNFERPIRVVDILRQALESAPRPWTHGELLTYVRDRRDLKSHQIEHYLPRIQGLVSYSAHCVGLKPVSRAVMIQLFCTEEFVLDRLVPWRSAASLEDLWLDEAGDDDRLSTAEIQMILNASSGWRSVRAYPGETLRFARESS